MAEKQKKRKRIFIVQLIERNQILSFENFIFLQTKCSLDLNERFFETLKFLFTTQFFADFFTYLIQITVLKKKLQNRN